MEKKNIAIVGATGLVGRKIIEVLEERNIRANYFLFANKENTNEKIAIFGEEHEVFELNEQNFKDFHLDYAFFAVEAEVSKKYAQLFAKEKIVVIDNSNAFRRKKSVPLIVPSVNKESLNNSFIIANPNCSTIQLAVALAPLKKFGLSRIVVSTYQAVSGAGTGGINDLLKNKTDKFAHPIFNNLIPQIDVFLDNSYTKEEDKLMFETRKILCLPKLKITATAVRIPLLNGHSESVNVQLQKKVSKSQILSELSKASGIIIQDEPEKNIYPMPLFASGKDDVFVGRIRRDSSQKNCFNMFVVADNLRRGAASNAVDIFMLKEKLKEF